MGGGAGGVEEEKGEEYTPELVGEGMPKIRPRDVCQAPIKELVQAEVAVFVLKGLGVLCCCQCVPKVLHEVAVELLQEARRDRLCNRSGSVSLVSCVTQATAATSVEVAHKQQQHCHATWQRPHNSSTVPQQQHTHSTRAANELAV